MLSGGGGLAGEAVERRPRRFRIDMVARDRRHAAPVVDPGGDHLGECCGVQIGRRLDVHFRPEDQPGNGNRPQMLVEAGLGRVGHPRARLGAEILDDDFLDVAIALVQLTQRQQ